MKIAMPYANGMVNPHFGQSREFIIFESEGKEVKGSSIINNEDSCHNHEGLAGLLKAQGVDVVITGGVGQPMVRALGKMGFKVVTGASGDVKKVANDYLNGTLETADIKLCGCGDHEHGDDHGHHC